jgi:hypothetical protein
MQLSTSVDNRRSGRDLRELAGISSRLMTDVLPTHEQELCIPADCSELELIGLVAAVAERAVRLDHDLARHSELLARDIPDHQGHQPKVRIAFSRGKRQALRPSTQSDTSGELAPGARPGRARGAAAAVRVRSLHPEICESRAARAGGAGNRPLAGA